MYTRGKRNWSRKCPSVCSIYTNPDNGDWPMDDTRGMSIHGSDATACDLLKQYYRHIAQCECNMTFFGSEEFLTTKKVLLYDWSVSSILICRQLVTWRAICTDTAWRAICTSDEHGKTKSICP